MILWRSINSKYFGNHPTVLGLRRNSSTMCTFRTFNVLPKQTRIFSNFKYVSPIKPYLSSHVIQRNFVRCASLNLRKTIEPNKVKENPLFVPVPLKIIENNVEVNIGEELSGKIDREGIIKLLTSFYKRPPVKQLAEENGLDLKLFHQAFMNFRKFCLETEALPVDLHLTFNDLLHDAGHVDDIFPYFLDYAKQIFPHLSCMEELQHISDIRFPSQTYPEARAMNRKVIFHAGPTNSGKTYHALERFLAAKTGVYCGPLRLLAVEIFNKANQKGTPCDLVTGEERQMVNVDGSTANHVACTVEMTSVTTPYEVAVIDEIQMVRDGDRGWAWTRALLGVAAQEVHICGEEASIGVIQEIVQSVGDEFEVHRYKRLTPLQIEKQALGSLDNVKPGDCIVCFNKDAIFAISLELEKKGIEFAVIYGALPPGTKIAQARKFNDPYDPCKVLVATDAIGMGLNLSIQRVIFNSLTKPVVNDKGEKEMDYISTSQALQIGGRAGRYGSKFETGLVTTFKSRDLPILKNIMCREVEPVTQVGLSPTAEQLEMFSYYLPHATMSNIIDIFRSLSQLDSTHYFLCHVENFKFLADMIQHIALPLRTRYLFCNAPINKQPLVCTMFLKFARQYSRNEAVTFDWLYRNIGWPFSPPKTIVELEYLEASFDVLDLYLWLSYRFTDVFPDRNVVKDMQQELDIVIQQGVINITRLLRGPGNGKLSEIIKTYDEEDNLLTKNKQLTEKNTKRLKASVKSKITERLMATGLLTKDMLSQLKKELNDKDYNNSDKVKKKPSKKR